MQKEQKPKIRCLLSTCKVKFIPKNTKTKFCCASHRVMQWRIDKNKFDKQLPMCYLCAMNVQDKRSYAKESTKSKPTGVRFDLEKVDFIKAKEKLNTYQKVVDFLLNKYWWEHKIAKPTHKEVPMVYDVPKTDRITHDEYNPWQEAKPKIDQYAAY